MNNNIGAVFKFLASKVLREVYGKDQYGIEMVFREGYGFTNALVELERIILAAMSFLANELYNEGGVSIPTKVRDAILHSNLNDPCIVKMAKTIKDLRMTEKRKAEIAYGMMQAISRQHQEDYAHEFLKEITPTTYVPNPENTRKHPYDPLATTRFIMIELVSWKMLENEYYPVARVVMSAFGITPLYDEVKQLHKNKQQELVKTYKLRSKQGLIEYIRENRMSMINSVDTIIRHGSYPVYLANRILKETPDFFKIIPLNDTSWEQLEIVE